MKHKHIQDNYIPKMSQSGIPPTHSITAYDNAGKEKIVDVAGELPLTIKINESEIVTLMTIGMSPEELALGYLKNQHFFENIEDIESVNVNWDKETVFVKTVNQEEKVDWKEKLSKRTVTTGCGQGTVFSCSLDKIYNSKLPQVAKVKQSLIYALLRELIQYNDIYKKAGAVHGCALCKETRVVSFVEDVGRHNAADSIAGKMWLDRIDGNDKIFYTTGRLTSEIVMKVANMGIPILLSRSGVTHMGLELAQDLNVTMIARAKGKAFLVYNGKENIIFDQIPNTNQDR